MSQRSCLSVILAAGEGTRMKSAQPKVLHQIAGLPMVAHVVKAAEAAGASGQALVIGHGAEEMRKAAAKFAPKAEIFVQEKRLGTAHAVLAAREAISKSYDDVLVMFGDTPLIDADALTVARLRLAEGAAVVVIGFRTPNPTGYGRLIEKGGKLIAIREEKDCSAEERKIGFCNAGMMAVAGAQALKLLDAVGNNNAKGEYYLTDIVEIASAQGLDVVATEASFESALGINNRAELAQAEAIWQQRRRQEAMLSGVTLIAPETVFFSHDTEIGADTYRRAQCLVRPRREDRWRRQDPCLQPYRRRHHRVELRCRAVCAAAAGCRSQAEGQGRQFLRGQEGVIEEGAKVNHLTYIGDARVGAGANIGAGTITCNYDGYSKFFTDIGEGAFIGSNSSLVAPVTIGKGGYIASGSVITESVPDDALAFGRARQKTIPGKGKELRERFASAAAAKKK